MEFLLKSPSIDLAMITKMINIDSEDPNDHINFTKLLKDYFMRCYYICAHFQKIRLRLSSLARIMV